MITRETIYSKAIEEYINRFKELNKPFQLQVFLSNKEKETLNLPDKAFVQNNILIADFANWTLEQIEIEDNTLKCVLVFDNENNEPVEYPINFSLINVLAITEINLNKREKNFKIDKKKYKAVFSMINGDKIEWDKF